MVPVSRRLETAVSVGIGEQDGAAKVLNNDSRYRWCKQGRARSSD
jgi:hypothetical protein